jgi:serine/threonine protein phosphatase 1
VNLIKSVKKNQLGRDFVVGDIHGCFNQLDQALESVRFNPSCDRLFSVGDLVDRGPQSAKCLEYLALPWFYAVSGNHEQMAIEYLLDGIDEACYQHNGGQWLIDTKDPDDRERFLSAFAALPMAIEVETDFGLVGIVHAQCSASTWSEFKAGLNNPATSYHYVQDCTWGRKVVYDLQAQPVAEVHRIVCGHTIVSSAQVRGNHHFIDTGAFKNGHLTIGKIQG